MNNPNGPDDDVIEEIPELSDDDHQAVADEMTDISKLSREELRAFLERRLERLRRQRREWSDALQKYDPSIEGYNKMLVELEKASTRYKETEAQLALLRRRQIGITSITIENFKGVSAAITIPLRSITLLFGANSAGKSTIIQALHYARELLERNNADADIPMAGGNVVDLGGFSNLVHKHDLNLPVRIKLEIVPEAAYGIPRLQDPVIASKAERAEVWDSDFSHLVNTVGIELMVKWSFEEQSPWLAEVNISYNGKEFASIKREFPQGVPFVQGLDADHPFLEPLLNDNKNDTAYYEFDTFLRKIKDDSGRVKLHQKTLVPEFSEKLPINIPPANDQYEGFCFWGCVELVNQLIHGPILLLRWALTGFRYLGPVRVFPDRNHRCPKIGDESRWADGSAAWDLVLQHYDPKLGKGDAFVQEVSQWMSSEDKLALGYSLDVRAYLSFPEDSMLMANLRLLREQFEEKDQEFYRKLIWGELEKADVQPRFEIHDLRNDVSVGPSDVGVGVTQVVPVVVASLDPKKQLVAIEQPELHLHPKVACNLADLFISQIGKEKLFLVETHSEHLMLRVMRRVREKQIGPEDVCVLFIEAPQNGGRTRIMPLRLNEEGEFLDEWPGGFFEEGFDEVFGKP